VAGRGADALGKEVGEAMKKSAVLFLLPAIVIAIMVSLYAIGHYRWLLALAISQCLSGVLSNYLMIQYRDMMEIAAERKRLREKIYSYSWEANPAQDASKEPWRSES